MITSWPKVYRAEAESSILPRVPRRLFAWRLLTSCFKGRSSENLRRKCERKPSDEEQRARQRRKPDETDGAKQQNRWGCLPASRKGHTNTTVRIHTIMRALLLFFVSFGVTAHARRDRAMPPPDFHHGRQALRAHFLQQAELHFQSAIRKAPEFPGSYIGLGMTLIRKASRDRDEYALQGAAEAFAKATSSCLCEVLAHRLSCRADIQQ